MKRSSTQHIARNSSQAHIQIDSSNKSIDDVQYHSRVC